MATRVKYEAASLEGLPSELGREISSRLPPSGVAGLQRASRRSQYMSREAMTQLCEQLPTEKEVDDYERYLDEVLSEHTVSRYDPKGGIVCRLGRVHPTGCYVINTRDGWSSIVVEDADEMGVGYAIDESRGIPDPWTVLAMLRRRVGCRSIYNRQHGKDLYGLDIVRDYVRGVLYQYLVPILGVESVELLYRPKDRGDIADLMLPVAEGEDEVKRLEKRQNYQRNLQRLRLLVWLWWIEMQWEEVEHAIANEHHVVIADGVVGEQRLLASATELLTQVELLDKGLQYSVWSVDKQMRDALPTDKQVREWIASNWTRREGLRVGFFDTYKKEVIVLKAVNGSVSISKIRLINVDYKTKEWTRLETTDNELTIQDIIKSLPGRADPITMLTIMREREGRVESTEKYGIEEVRKYLGWIQMTLIGYGRAVIAIDAYTVSNFGIQLMHAPEEVARRGYNDVVQYMRLINVWTGAGTYEQKQKWLNSRPTDNEYQLQQYAIEAYSLFRTYRMELSDVAGGEWE